MAETTRKLQLGVSMPTWDDGHSVAASWAEMRSLAKLIEQADIDTIWVPDHLYRLLSDGRPFGFWECWTILSALAETTSHATIGSLITCTGFRNPALVAKMAETVDEISSGRLILGLGAGVPDHDLSWLTFGYLSDHPAGRFEEAVEIIARLLREGHADFRGSYYSVHDLELVPRGPRSQGLPIWLAAKGSRTTKIAAHWADAFNLNVLATKPGDLEAPFALLDSACNEIGRDPATIMHTGYTIITFAPPDADMSGIRANAIKGSAEEIAAQLHALHKAGMQHMTCYIDAGDKHEPPATIPLLTPLGLERFVEVITALRKLEADATN